MFGGANAGSMSTSFGLRNFVSSSRPCPSGVRIITMSTWTACARHAERGEKSDSGCKVVDDDADVVQSLDRHVRSIAGGRAR